MDINKIRDFYSRHNAYSLQDYTRDAQKLIFNRINYNQFDRQALLPDPGSIGSLTTILDPQHAAQWSALSRKRKSGIMLLILYAIASEYDLDMTATLGHRMLQGLFDCSISNKTLISAFGEHGRTAADKSEDWEKIGTIVKNKREWALKKLHQNRTRLRKNKETAWDLVKLHFQELNAKKKTHYK